MLRLFSRLAFLGVLLAGLAPNGWAAAESEADRLQKLERAVHLLEQRNAELEREVHHLKQQDLFSPMLPAATGKVAPGSDDKAVFTAAPPPKVDVRPGGPEYRLTLGGYIQANFEDGDVSAFEGRFGATALKERFRVRRARITAAGDFKEDFDFKVQGEFELNDSAVTGLKSVDPTTGATTTVSNSNRVEFAATDIYVNWHRYAEANLKVGQYKAPFGLEYLTASTQLLTIERSLPTSALVADRQIGVMVWGKPLAHLAPRQKELVTYYAGLFNGNGRNINNNDNDDFMYVGRVELRPWQGKLGGWESQLSLGGDYLYSRDNSGTNISPSGNLRVNPDGSLSSYILTSAANRSDYSFDAALKVGPFDLSGEYLYEQSTDVRSLELCRSLISNPAAGMCREVTSCFREVGRWESFDPDQLANDDLHSVVGGVNYYLRGDSLKLMADYVHTWSDFRSANPQLGDDQFDELLLRLQVIF